uniref:Uncharacterized protein LOC104248368 n=1 Tax=Nicotiana sylvestris TaxID=4096 RepID=A0A1U7YLQ9_NICSY|nr:PREDICTED: uncharacterized protein LOC104248368 [Nicotiana sylvestris]
MFVDGRGITLTLGNSGALPEYFFEDSSSRGRVSTIASGLKGLTALADFLAQTTSAESSPSSSSSFSLSWRTDSIVRGMTFPLRLRAEAFLDFPPSRGNTLIHPLAGNLTGNRTPAYFQQLSPTDEKKRLFELFEESLRSEQDKNGHNTEEKQNGTNTKK